MLNRVVKIFGGDPIKKAIEEHSQIVDLINSFEHEYEALDDEVLRAKTDEFKSRLAQGETLDDLLPEAYAAVREASKRTLGMRHYDVQLIGGIVMHLGQIAEMRTGEGKTLVATLPLYLNALTGKGVHLVTVNDYLARRDARWMAPIYNFLGMSVGVLQMAARTESGRKAFVVDLEQRHASEDQDQLVLVPRKQAYAADITYGTNNEFGFDYLRDNMALSLASRVQRGHYFAIIDEVDNVLIDEARTPLIISGPSHDDTEEYARMASVVKRLSPEDYEVSEKDRTALLTEIGEAKVEHMLGESLRDPERPEDITPVQARLMGFLEQAMRAQFLYKRNKDYTVQGGKVVIIDESTGRLMPGRRWSDGLHQAVEAKENVRVQSENVTYATITIQNYYRMYEKLAGMTGTALTEAEEFSKIYDLEVVPIPPNVAYNATRPDSPITPLQDIDEYGYKYTYYARPEEPNKPIFWKRKDYPDVVYRTVEAKLRAIAREIIIYHLIGRPTLVGTTSVENSVLLSNRLRAEPIRRLLQTLLLRDVWFEKNNRQEDGRIVLALTFLNEPLDKLKPNELRQLARQLDITLNLEDPQNLPRLLDILGLSPQHQDRLLPVLKGGIPHQVLNARKHTEESQIIAHAGGFGAVTIATNMAGRGVDIKLGGEIPEEILGVANRVLRRESYEGVYDMSIEAKKEALAALDQQVYGIYAHQVNSFLEAVDNMAKVKQLGGLHVIGSERHNARRIDNQLRGRAARQGDPGSSRFYLSMEDDLMRLFGGQQVDALMQRIGVDDALPLESNLVSRIIEQSQTRVEGANFDSRKHLLEYDDVLNDQRTTIYAQRDRIFTKVDLSDDVAELLHTEISQRVPEALDDNEGPWRLLAWLEQIQPSFIRGQVFFPSYTYKLLIDHLEAQNITTAQDAQAALLKIAEESLLAEEEHHLRSIKEILERTEENLDALLEERIDTLDTFLEGLSLHDEDQSEDPRQLLNELSGLVRVPVKLANDQLHLLSEDTDEAAEIIAAQIESYVYRQAITRVIGSVERRLREPLDLNAAELAEGEWSTISNQVLATTQSLFDKRRQRLIGDNYDGQIAKELQSQLAKAQGGINTGILLNLLISMPQGTQTAFDKKTHRRVIMRTTRLNYTYFAANFVEDADAEEVTQNVLAHLESARRAMQQAIGASEWSQLANLPFEQLDQKTQKRLSRLLGEETLQSLKTHPLNTLKGQSLTDAINALGRQALNETYRSLLLRIISDLWVDYLTQMEALRVSIGLEAYAQRDPLVQYKTRAFEMFQKLFSDMRMGMVSRMFTFLPRDPGASGPRPDPSQDGQTQAASAPAEQGSKPQRKRRRKRKRK